MQRAGGSSLRLDGRVAVVTGASRGIGAEVAVQLAEHGAELILTARDDDQLARTADRVAAAGARAHVVRADLGTAAGVDAVASAASAHGRVAVLVNNAGAVGPFGVLWQVRADEWERLLALNLQAPFRLAHAFLPGMIEAGWGRIVNVTSSASLEPLERTGAYSTAKAALNMLTRQLASELQAHPGIRVTAFAPGPADTATYAMLRAQPPSLVGAAGFERFRRTAEEGRLAPPDGPARVIVALAVGGEEVPSGAYVDIADAYAQSILGRGER